MTIKSFIVWSLVVSVIVALDMSITRGDIRWIAASLNRGVMLRYPSNWQLISITKEGLAIKSSKGGYEGIGIGPNQAEIIASLAKADASISLDEFVAESLREQTILARQEVPVSGHGCVRLQKVVSLFEVGPGAFIENTGYFCRIGDGWMVVMLRNFRGNKQQPQYQQIALRMARSIRRQGS